MEVRGAYCRLITGRPERPKVAESIKGSITVIFHYAALSGRSL
jgi:hypothetical protein